MFKQPIIKWLIVLGLIYFTINFTSSNTINPSWLFLKALIVFLVFILFMKQHKITFYLSLIILILIFSMNQYLTYYQTLAQNSPNTYKSKINKLNKTILALEIILIVVLIAGNIIYLLKQYRDHPYDFSLLYFYFGTNKCKSMDQFDQQVQTNKKK
jgi:Ca2+/Na+ antiporter